MPRPKLIMALGAVTFAASMSLAQMAGAADTVVNVTPPSPTGQLYFGLSEVARGKAGPGTGGPSCAWTLLSLPGQSGTWDPYRDSSGILWQAWSKACTGQPTLTYWVPVLPPSSVVPEYRDDIIRMIPETLPVWSPLMPTQYVSYPTYVWLEKAKTVDIVLPVLIPSVSATMTAKVGKVVFNPGIDADAVTCAGVPLKRKDCAYTYRQTSKDEPNLRYQASVSVTWDISWTASTGESGTLAPFVATADMPIAVAKIQAVGA